MTLSWFANILASSRRRKIGRRPQPVHLELEILEKRITPQATRTWVSGVGDDANPDSRTAPGKTFAGTIAKTAAGGIIQVLDPGDFGTVTINKALTIDGTGTIAAISASSGAAITVNAGPTDVVILRDLKLQGNGKGAIGVDIISAGAVYVENCDIENFTGAGIDFEPTNTGAQLFVSQTALLDNAGGGILLTPNGVSATAEIDHVNALGNKFGIRANDFVVATVSNSDASGNLQDGFQTVSVSNSAQMNLQSDVASNNGLNGVTSEGAKALVTFSDLTATGNSGMGILAVSNGGLLSDGTNQITDNARGFTPITVNPTAGGGAIRTWVSGVGDDVNPGSRTAPDKTFAGAISKTATGGEIDVLDPGGFGAVTITHSITIDGSDAQASILVSGTNAIVINAAPTDVVILRNLKFQGLGNGLAGIKILGAGAVYIEDCDIQNFGGAGIDFEPTNAGAQLFVINTLLDDNAGGGVLVKPGAAAHVVLDGVEADGNGFGVEADGAADVAVSNSGANGSTGNGFQVGTATAGAVVNLYNVTAANNGGNGVASTGAGSVVNYAGLTATGNSALGTAALSGGVVNALGANLITDNSKGFTPITLNPVVNITAATRTWVSGVGDDVNPDSRTAPGKTFAGAISKTSAGGEIDALDSGGFGPVTISHTLTIDGGDVLASVLVSTGNGITINAAPSDVVILRNLKLQGLGSGLAGIEIFGAGAVYIENCDIQNFAGAGIDFEPTNAGAQLFVINCKLDDNAGGGVLVKPPAAARVVLDGVETDGNRFGVEVDGAADVTARNGGANGNNGNGYQAGTVTAGAVLNLSNVTASNNGSNGVVSTGAGTVVNYAGLTATGNAALGVAAMSGGGVNALGNNLITDNSKGFTPIAVNPVAGVGTTRTWVSGVGDDANPGSRTAPGKTFAGMISKTTAGGEIDVLDPGGFGNLTITKSITIDGSGSFGGILSAGPNGIVINAASTDVIILRGLTLDGDAQTSPIGIDILSAGAVYIEDCDIENFVDGIVFAPTDAGAQLFVDNSVVVHNKTAGVLIQPNGVAARAFVNGVAAEGGVVGVETADQADATVSNSIAAGNSANGFAAVASSASSVLNLEGSVATINATGVFAQGPTGGSSSVSATANVGNVNASGNSGVAFLAAGATPTDSFIHTFSQVVPTRDFVAADFPGLGIWQFDGTTQAFQQVRQNDATILAVNANGDIAAEFANNGGLWRYTQATQTWQQLTQANASALAIDAAGDVVSDLAGLGVYLYTNSTGFQHLSTANANLLAMDGAGDVFANFTSASGFATPGVNRYSATAHSWSLLNGTQATLLAADAAGDVFTNFVGYGVAQYTASTNSWRILNGTQATLLAVDNAGDAAVVFQGYAGIAEKTALGGGFVFVVPATASELALAGNGDVFAVLPDSNVWEIANLGATDRQLTVPGTAVMLPAMDQAGDLFVSVANQGVYRHTSGISWQQLVATSASLLAVDAAGDVAANFPNHGVSLYNHATGAWTQISPTNVTLLAMDAAGDVFAEFPGHGVQRYPAAGGGFQFFAAADATALAADANGDLALNFANGGLYRYIASVSMFQQLNAHTATLVAIDAAGDVYANLSGLGVYRYLAGSTTGLSINGTNATALATDAAGDLFVAFQGYGGTYRSAFANPSAFQQIASGNPTLLTDDLFGDVFLDFSTGYYQYTTGGGVQLLTGTEGRPSVLA